MGNLIKLGIAKIGLVKQKGLVLSVGLVKKIVEYDYYQWLKLDDPTDLVNYGTGGTPELDALLISGSMATKDIVINWTRGDAGLTALARYYGIPDPQISWQQMKDLNGYNHPLNLKQLFLKEQPIFENEELKDFSNTPVNAEVWGYAIRDNVEGLPLGTLLEDIELDFATDGLKWEFGFSINAASTNTVYFYAGANSSQVAILKNTYVQQTIFINNDTCRSLTFTGLQIEYDDTPLRMKCEVVGTDVTITYTNLEDENYQNILGTQTKSVTGLPNYGNGIGLTSVASMPYRLTTSIRLRGTMYFMNVGDASFLLQDKWDSRELTTGRLFSNGSYNMINSDMQDVWINQNILKPTINGYVRYTTGEGRLQFNRPIIGIDDTEAFVQWWLDNVQPLVPALDLSYEKFENGEFADGWGFTLNAQFEPLDQDNTYFDASSNANVITANKQPSKLNNRIYWDRENNKDIKLYDTDVDIVAPINCLDENTASIGDSVAGNNWFFLGSLMTGYAPEYFFYGGRTASETEEELRTAIVSDPTMISRQKIIIITCGFNDYAKNTSEAQFLIDYRSLVDYVKNEASTNATIILNAVYIWKLTSGASDPLDDGNTPNPSGLTMNGINNIQKQVAIEREVYLCDLQQAGIINTDLADIVHPATSSGNLKIIIKVLETLNSITEGIQPALIPKQDFTIDNSGDIIKDMASQPYQAKYYSDGKQAFTSDGKEVWVIKTFE